MPLVGVAVRPVPPESHGQQADLVMAETDDWVAMASEFRAIAVLPGAQDARVWEPEPGEVYVYERAAVA